MANINLSDYKLKMLVDFISSPKIVAGIESQSEKYIPDEPDSLIYSNLFPYRRIPDTQTNADTYILVAADIINPTRANSSFVDIRLTCWIMAHQERMKMTNINSTRIDYLAKEVSDILNESTKYGYGVLRLISNQELILDERYQYRSLVFNTFDLSDSMCGN